MTGGICILKVIPVAKLTPVKLQLLSLYETPGLGEMRTCSWQRLEQIARRVIQITIVSGDIK